MPQIIIRGIPVEFPKEPYECQIRYMDKVLEALETGKNAMLESPTGTGKTLCLLCATLAWQNYRKEKFKSKNDINVGRGLAANLAAAQGNGGNSSGAQNRDASIPVIIYASRTHSQLAQVVDELRSTPYRPRMTVLGSREQLCIHEKISKLKGAMINHSCNALNSKRACMYKNNLENMLDGGGSLNTSVDSNDIVDIEDLVKMGNKRRVCSYFYSRETSANSEIVFMPYNYLLDSSIRKTLKLAWENSIIIFDEAHNLERVASDAASFTFTSTDIASCIQEMQQIVSILRDQHVVDEVAKDVKESVFGAVTETGTQRPTLASAASILASLFQLENRLDAIKLVTPYGGTQPPSVVMSGPALVDLVKLSGFNNEIFIEEVKKSSNMLMEETEAALATGDSVLGGAAPLQGTEPKLNLLASALDRLFRASKQDGNDYKVYISEEKEKSTQKSNDNPYGQKVYQNNKQAAAAATKRIINYWCFSTGVALKELTALGIRSVLITSGTLSPMEAMKEDMRIPFPIELQNPHVIGDKQIMVAALSTGSRGKTLNSSYANRDSTDYKEEIGHTILSIYRTMATAEMKLRQERIEGSCKGGVLVFFPAYAAMDSTIERWKQCGLYETLKADIGSIIIEPKGNAKPITEVSTKTTGFQQRGGAGSSSFMLNTGNMNRNRNNADPEDEGFSGIVDEFNNAIDKYGSCLLLAVCRGKVSEGIDFSNNKGRVVIVTGIPFAPFQDPWVMLKKQYLDEKTSATSLLSSNNTAVINSSGMQQALHQTSIPQPYQSMPSSSTATNIWQKAKLVQQPPQPAQIAQYPPPPPHMPPKTAPTAVNRTNAMNGQMWYNQSASRAVNQCLGRVIRHKNDWGAIYLLDERFCQDAQISQLSGWMRPKVKKFKSFNDSASPLNSFLISICHDPILRFNPEHEKAAKQKADHSNSLVISSRNKMVNKANDADEAIRRFVEISELDLANKGDDAQSYIDKDILSTQSVTILPQGSKGKISRETLNDTVPLYPLFQEKKEPVDLKSIIDKMKKKESTSGVVSLSEKAFMRPAYPSSSSSSSAMGGLHPYAGSQSAITSKPKTSFGLSKESSDSTFGVVDLTQPMIPSSQSTAFPPSSQLSQAIDQDPNISASQPSTNTSSGLTAFSRKSILQQKQQATSTKSQEEVIRDIINGLKTRLSFLGMKQFKELIIDVKEIGGLQLISQIKKFQVDLAKILQPLSDDMKLQIATELVCLIHDRNLRQAYLDSLKQTFGNSSAATKRKVDENNESVTVMPTQPLSTTSSLSYMKDVVAEDDVENLGSKRAKLLIQKSLQAQASQSSSAATSTKLAAIKQEPNTSAPKDSFLSKMKEISSFQGIKAGSSNVMSLQGSSSSSLLKCIICKEQAQDACAARCGHICCQVCWTQWLKVKSACPLCRHPTTVDSITKIKIKS